MAINLDEYLQAIEPPSFTYKGVTYTGRTLKFNDALRLLKAMDTVVSEEETKSFAQEVFRTAGIEATVPVDELVQDLHLAGFKQLVIDFFTSAVSRPKRP